MRPRGGSVSGKPDSGRRRTIDGEIHMRRGRGMTQMAGRLPVCCHHSSLRQDGKVSCRAAHGRRLGPIVLVVASETAASMS